MMSGFERMPYRLNAADGPAVDYRFWSSGEDQLTELDRSLGDLLRDGIHPEHITILSPVRFDRSVASELARNRWKVVDITGGATSAPDGGVRFSTIHSFKGMETPVAVMTDLRGIEEADRHALLYVGMSRARTCLVMLVHQTIRPHVEAAFRRRVREGS